MTYREVSEWLKEHAWKVCMRETASRVRIPSSLQEPQCLVVAAFNFMAYFVYILYSVSADRYYTAPHVPWVIQKATRGEAMILEKKIKNMNREKLSAFIAKYG
jgi:hypothetical protein